MGEEAVPVLVLDPAATSRKDTMRMGPGSSAATIFNQLASIIGPGALAVPYAIKCFGAVSGSCLLFFSAGSSYFTCTLLIKCVAPCHRLDSPLLGSTTRQSSYPQLVERMCGSSLRCLADVGIIGNCFGSLVGVLHVIYTTVPTAFWHTAWQGHCFIISVATFVVLPLSIPEELSQLRYAGILCFAANLFTLGVIGLRFFFGDYVKSWPDVMAGVEEMEPYQWMFNTQHPSGMLTAVPIFAQIFNAHWALLPLFSELRDPTRGRMASVTRKSVAGTALLYAFSGLLAFLTWLDGTKPNILLNFSTHDGLMLACRYTTTPSVS